jgi:hypothetical protein
MPFFEARTPATRPTTVISPLNQRAFGAVADKPRNMVTRHFDAVIHATGFGLWTGGNPDASVSPAVPEPITTTS